MKFVAFSALVAILPAYINAQAAEFAQCGGTGFTGPTTCVTGTVCIELNPFFSQCLPPSSAPAAPVSTAASPTSTAPAVAPTPNAGNPFTGFDVFLSPVYTSEVQAAAALITDSSTQALAASVANIPTFIWFDQVAKVPLLGTYLAAAQAQGPNVIVPIVVYDLPNRDCAALASNGEFTISDNGLANYMAYIDGLVAQIKMFPKVRVVAVIEPDSLANLVTNLNLETCAVAQPAYIAGVTYAIQQLGAVGVFNYLDAGHAGWLGWPANLAPAAQLFGSLLKNAGPGTNVRGLATNVANYNSLVTNTPDPITAGNPNFDEALYIEALSPLLVQQNFPTNFIVDQSRSGQQDLRQQWGDWCNVLGAGFGIRPTTNSGVANVDSIVWVKPGGESDGTSNSSAPRFDAHCALPDATPNAPQAGTWFQAFFLTLVTKANPPL